jgi:hypothetical protein
MKCPSCGAAVEEGADLCLECGEPMGDSPVAQVVRREEVVPPPSAPAPARPPASTVPQTMAAKRKRVIDDEPEAVRCPGCGMPSKRDRCPNCGTVLRRSDD